MPFQIKQYTQKQIYDTSKSAQIGVKSQTVSAWISEKPLMRRRYTLITK